MAHPRLRIYCGSDERGNDASSNREAKQRQETVTLPVGDVLPVLIEAVRSGRKWPQDFNDDEITISTDFYEVILAFQHYRRASA